LLSCKKVDEMREKNNNIADLKQRIDGVDDSVR
jgi:hypothetical protein